MCGVEERDLENHEIRKNEKPVTLHSTSVQFSHSLMSSSLWPHGLQHTRLPSPSPTPSTCSNSCPSNQWCHPTISSSVVHFSSCLLSFPASGSFPMNQFFASDGQSIGALASASVLPMSIQDWFPSGLTSLISLQSKELSRVFSNTTVPKHQFFSTQLSLTLLSMTNLDSILKSRDITLPTKFPLVKVMVFPVVMYGCESWTIKKPEHWRIDTFELWCRRRLLRVPWTARRSNQPILKEISPEY